MLRRPARETGTSLRRAPLDEPEGTAPVLDPALTGPRRNGSERLHTPPAACPPAQWRTIVWNRAGTVAIVESGGSWESVGISPCVVPAEGLGIKRWRRSYNSHPSREHRSRNLFRASPQFQMRCPTSPGRPRQNSRSRVALSDSAAVCRPLWSRVASCWYCWPPDPLTPGKDPLSAAKPTAHRIPGSASRRDRRASLDAGRAFPLHRFSRTAGARDRPPPRDGSKNIHAP